MARSPLILTISLLLTLVLKPNLDSVWAQESPAGAVLLKNGRLLTGRITESGTFYRIQVADNSTVSIPRDQVEHVGADRAAIYAAKCAAIKRWNPGDHFQMTRWCLLNELPNEAIEHYRQVSKDAPNHPRVRQLAVEVEKKLLSDPGFRDFLGLAPEPAPAERLVASEPPTDSTVVAAGSSMAQAAKHPQIAARFAQRIQPILLNRCSQAACHGSLGKSQFRIIEPYRSAHARITTENLQNVLAFADADDETVSPLLRYATSVHGIQRQAAISLTEHELLQEISDWIRFMKNPVVTAGGNSTAGQTQATTAGGFTPVLSPGVTLVPVQPGSSGLRQVPRVGAELGFPNGDAPLASEIDELDRQLRQILGEPAPAQTPPSDPFDPAEFNRQSGN